MATRFYFTTNNTYAFGTNPNVTLVSDPGWEITGTGTVGRNLELKAGLVTLTTIADSNAVTIPITTTQDILHTQFVSIPIPAQTIDTSCLFSLAIRVFENATTNNATLAVVAKVVTQTGALRGTLFSNFNQDTEFAVSASAATRIVAQTAVTAVTTQPGDRISIEIGAHATAPTAAGSFTPRYGNSNTSDFALTSALTTDLNPWCEFSKDLFNVDNQNYKFVKAGSGISVTEKIR